MAESEEDRCQLEGREGRKEKTNSKILGKFIFLAICDSE